MEKLSDGAQILLDYRHRNSDVDFNDVFGGPPRRRSSFSPDSQPFSGRGGGSGEGIVGSRRPWSGSGEKPAFGDSGSPLCRRQLGDDFFSDIFPSSDSSCSSPRKPDRDPLNSSPGSRVLSPTRPLPPRCDPFVGGSSLPAQLSLSMKMAKGIDHPTFNYPTQRSPYKKDVGIPDAFGFATRAVPLNDDLRTDPHTFYRQSPLSRPLSHGLDRLSRATISSSLSIEVQSEEDPTTLEGYVSSDRFHFSIYKWAGKGVTLIMPSNTKEKIGSRLRRLPEVVLQGAGLSSCNDDMPTMTTESQSQSENPDNKFLKDLIMDKIDGANFTAVDELLPAGFESKSLHSDVTEESGRESEFKNLRQLLDDGLYKQGNEDIVKQDAETEDFSRSRKNLYGDANANQQGPRENSMKHFEDKVRGSKVKGKVKEFIKIFNNEASPKRKGLFDTQNRRSRGKDGVKEKVEDQDSAPASVTVEETKEMSRSSSKSLVDNSTAINQISKKADNPDNIACSDVHKINDCSPEMNCTLEPLAEPTPEIIDASVCDIWESHCEDLEGCLVEELSQDQAEHPPSDSYRDQIKVSDAKIREWSKGKEGNVRSLLSTLQYVLWPDSGWKPVPLVDIIEGTSVKRAYQKALLSLHPDKLQQKGASLQQKYIAEKVFDILQEAWDHFNSMSSF